MSNDNAIEVKNVCKGFKCYYDRADNLKSRLIRRSNKYSYREILRGLSFSVKKGEAVALIGENGCGKSTTLKLLTKIIYPNSGSINLEGRVVSLIELGAGFHPDMSGRENIFINASIFGLSRKEINERLDDIIRFSELEEFIDNPVRTYSSGMYMRLAFSVAINVDADILLIDEILAVGDAAFQAKCFKRMREIKGCGTTIVLVSHSMTQVEQLCDRSIWIHEGKVRAEGKPRDIDPMYLNYMAMKMTGENIASRENEIQESVDESTDDLASPLDDTRLDNAEKNNDAIEELPNNDPGNRFGCRDVYMNRIRFLNEDGKEVNTVMTEGGFSIEIEYVVNKKIKNACFGIGVFRNDGVGCYGTNTVIERFDPFDIEEDGKLRIVFPKTLLIQGSYRIDLAIQCEGGIPVDYYKNALQFDVVSNISDVDIVRIPHYWQSDLLHNGANM